MIAGFFAKGSSHNLFSFSFLSSIPGVWNRSPESLQTKAYFRGQGPFKYQLLTINKYA